MGAYGILGIATAMGLLTLPATARADGLAEVWARKPAYVITSQRPIETLEMCIALAMSERALPSSVHGKGEVIISTTLARAADQLSQSVRITELGDSRRIEVAAVKKIWKESDEIKMVVEKCAIG
jgi:hypothetical protein